MKRTINFLTTLIIFTTVFSLSSFCLNVKAQTSGNKKQAKEEKREAKKFVDSFIQSLEETKDLNQVPERFFAADFKTRLAKNYSWFSDSSDFFKQLSDFERYDGNISFINFSYLGMMCSGGKDVDFAADADETSEDKVDAEKIFPPHIFDLVRKSKTLNALFNDDADSNIKNVAQLIELFTDMKMVADAERKYLNENKTKWESNYAKNVKKARGEFKRYKSELCEGKDCEGLPSKTQIIYTLVFPFMFSIIKENNELRILDINFPSQ